MQMKNEIPLLMPRRFLCISKWEQMLGQEKVGTGHVEIWLGLVHFFAIATPIMHFMFTTLHPVKDVTNAVLPTHFCVV